MGVPSHRGKEVMNMAHAVAVVAVLVAMQRHRQVVENSQSQSRS